MAELKEKLALFATMYKLQGGTPEKHLVISVFPERLRLKPLSQIGHVIYEENLVSVAYSVEIIRHPPNEHCTRELGVSSSVRS